MSISHIKTLIKLVNPRHLEGLADVTELADLAALDSSLVKAAKADVPSKLYVIQSNNSVLLFPEGVTCDSSNGAFLLLSWLAC